jgi:hypothetical protein
MGSAGACWAGWLVRKSETATANARILEIALQQKYQHETGSEKQSRSFGAERMMDASSDVEQHAGNDEQNRREYDGAGRGKGTPGYDIVSHGGLLLLSRESVNGRRRRLLPFLVILVMFAAWRTR